MKTKLLLILSITTIFIITSCKTTRIIIDEPVLGNLPERPERINSQISLPMEIDISTIQDFINENLPKGQIASGSGSSGNTKKFSYKIYRNNTASFTAKGDELIFRIPLDIEAKGSYTSCIAFWRNGDCCSSPNPFGNGCFSPGVTSTEHGNASPKVIVQLGVRLKIQEDYSIKAETYLKGELSGDTHLKIDLIGDLIRINIDIKDKLEKPLQDFIEKYSKEIEEKVSQLVQSYELKEEVNTFWEEVKEPISIGDLWLRIKPQKVIFENLNAKNGKLRIGLGFESVLEVVDSIPNVINDTLPNLEITQSTKGQFNIYLPVSSSFDNLSEVAKEEVVGNQYEKDGVKIKIKDIDIKGVELNNVGALLIKLNVKGRTKFTNRFKGNLYFTAIPSINDVTKEISVSDFKIEANTNSFLINNGLPYLIDNYYYDDLKEELKLSYKKEQEKYRQIIENELKEILVDNVIINATLDSLNIPGIYIDKNGLEVLLIAKGKLSSTIKNN